MANTPISGLPAADTIVGTEQIPLVQSAVTKRVDVDTLISNKDIVRVHRNVGTPDYFMDAAGNNLSVVNAAPKSAVYLVGSSDAGIPNARVLTGSVSMSLNTDTPNVIEVRREAVTGDITIPANSNLATLSDASVSTSKLANSAVTNAKQAPQNANTLKANVTASSANPTDFAVTTNSLVGRGTGNITNITLDSSLSMSAGGVLSVATGSGEANTASNVNVGGVGIFKQKTALDLEFRGVNAGSSKVSVTLDDTNNEIDIDVVESNLLVGGRNSPLLGKLALTFSNGTLDNDPNTGKFKFNSATIGSITTLWVDDLDANSRNIVNDLNALVSGDKWLVYDSTGVTLHTIFTLSSVATDKTGYRQFSGTCSGGAGTLPANLAGCVVVILSKQALNAILQIDNFARFQSNGSGGLNLITNTGAVVESVVNVYALPGKTISGVATLPAASSVPVGTEALLHKDNFVGTGSNPVGVKIVSDGTLWRPLGHQTLFSASFGTVASPTMTRTTTGRFALTDPIIPGGLLYAGAKLRIRGSVYVINASATTGVGVQIYFGTDTTTYTNNSKALLTNTTGTANGLTNNLEPLLHFPSTTTGVSSRASGKGGSGATGGFQDMIAGTPPGGIDLTADQMVTYEIPSLGSATQVNLMTLDIVWEW